MKRLLLGGLLGAFALTGCTTALADLGPRVDGVPCDGCATKADAITCSIPTEPGRMVTMAPQNAWPAEAEGAVSDCHAAIPGENDQ